MSQLITSDGYIHINNLIALAFVLAGAVVLAFYGFRYRKSTPEAREFPIFKRLANQVGRAAEEGASIHIALGKGDLTGDGAMTSVAALQSLTALMDLSAAYDTPPIITTSNPLLYLLAGDWMRRAYERLDSVALYQPTMVQFTAASPTVYAAMAAAQLSNSNTEANIMLGVFEQECVLIADAAQRKDIYSAGGTTLLEGVSALYPILNREELVIGEELFAGGAIVTQQPTYWASLWTQDVLRWGAIMGTIGAAVIALIDNIG
ncbi:MAG: hypothetical protein JXA33_11860 [Anaerolineae bacterium]|nr:hypothetical protein [Anaerolineae bacterium]